MQRGKKKGMVEGSYLGVEWRASFIRGKEYQVLITRMINTKDNILSEPTGRDGLVV